MQGAKILIVDDEPKIRRAVEQALQKEGFRCLQAGDGPSAWRVFQEERPDLVILDLMLPGEDGFEVCRRIRAQSQVPVIILSVKGELTDKVAGFTLGVDDYLTKPFSPAELVLRVKAVLRRAYAHQSAPLAGEVIRAGDLIINAAQRSVHRGEEEITLTAREFDLLWLLAAHPGRVFTKEQILDRIWGCDYVGDENVVPVLVRRLREKVEPDPARPRYIQTVWGVGYKFSPRAQRW
ncbi:MAG: response regulator transcription factor [Bacillota bacterium]|nr:response regulator transcription factor [Bacillota bacterium]